jgi:hypothetical protein
MHSKDNLTPDSVIKCYKLLKSLANSNNGQYLLVGANNGLFVSNDYGSTYTAI